MEGRAIDFLQALRDATETYRADRRYERWDGYFLVFGNARGVKPALLDDADDLAVDIVLIDELTDDGFLRQDTPSAGTAGGRKFALTAAGRRVAEEGVAPQDREPASTTVVSGSDYDVFLSHASEDKADFVLPLAAELQVRGISVWLDQLQMRLGDSLSQSIDAGLRNARFGVVVLSPAFFAKNWPRRELDGLVARETAYGIKVILPVWNGVTRDEVLSYSPPLADKLAADAADGVEAVASQIQEALGGPLRPGQAIRQVDHRVEPGAALAQTTEPPTDLVTQMETAIIEGRGGEVRAKVVEQINRADTAATLTDPDQFRNALDDLTTIAATVLRAMPADPVATFALEAYHRLFDATHQAMREGGLGPQAVVSLWPDLLAHVRALGALATRFELWTAVRRLASHAPPPGSGDIYPGWLCYMEVQLARRTQTSNAEQVRQPIRAAAELIGANLPLRPDAPSENGRLDSVLRFDFLSRVVEIDGAMRARRSTDMYPAFARFDATALHALTRRLVEDPSIAAELLPGRSTNEVLQVLLSVDASAHRASDQHGFWDGIADPETRRRIGAVG